MNVIKVIRGLPDFQARLPLFEEGYRVLTDPHAGRRNLSQSEFFRVLLGTALDDSVGVLMTLESRIQLGFVCVVSNRSFLYPARAEVFALYSNGKCPSALDELMYEARKWARSREFRELVFVVGRTTGAAKKFGRRLFENVGLVFSQEIL